MIKREDIAIKFITTILCLLTFAYMFTISSISYIIFGLYIIYLSCFSEIREKYTYIFKEEKVILLLIILTAIGGIISNIGTSASVHSYTLLRQRIEWMLIPFLLGGSISVLPISLKRSCLYIHYTCAACLAFIALNILYQGILLHIPRPFEWLSHDYCNTIAGIIAFSIFCFFSNYLVEKRKNKVFISIIWVLCIGALYVLETRGAVLGFIVSICLIVLYIIACKIMKFQCKLSAFFVKLIFISLFSVVVVGLIGLHFHNNITNRIYNSISTIESLYNKNESEVTIHHDIVQGGGDRIYLWQSSMRMIKDYPVFGVGTGNFNQVYVGAGYISPYARERDLISPHNIYLHILTENGIVGFVPFIILIIYMMYYLWTSIKYRNKLAIAVLLGYVSVLVQGLVDFPFLQRELSQIVWFYFGIIVSINMVMRRHTNV